MLTKAITQTELRKNIKKEFDNIVDNSENLIVYRGEGKDVVIMPLNEYNSIMESFHLLRSENNRKRLLESMQQIKEGKTKKINLDEL